MVGKEAKQRELRQTLGSGLEGQGALGREESKGVECSYRDLGTRFGEWGSGDRVQMGFGRVGREPGARHRGKDAGRRGCWTCCQGSGYRGQWARC